MLQTSLFFQQPCQWSSMCIFKSFSLSTGSSEAGELTGQAGPMGGKEEMASTGQ